MPSEPAKLTAEEVFGREFLPTRSKILELAAALDRIERAGSTKADGILRQKDLLHKALQILMDSDTKNRAEKIQQLFSREYDSNWYETWMTETRSKEETV